MRLTYWFAAGMINLFFKLFHQHKVYGIENIPKGPAIIAPNHLSHYDPPAVSISFPEELHYLAKDELFHYRFLGWLIRNLNAHPVSSADKDRSSMKLLSELLQQGKKVVIFPEGARSETGKILELKYGASVLALKNNVPIVPVYIRGTFEIWPIYQKYPRFSGKTSCTIGKPIYPSAYEGLEKREAQRAMTKDLHDALLELEKS